MKEPVGPRMLLPDWVVPSRVRAAFTLRGGGVSQAPFEALNLGIHVGDAPEHVYENRALVRRALRLPAEPIWLKQVHGTDVLDLDGVFSDAGEVGQRAAAVAPEEGGAAEPPVADAAITRRTDRVCVVQVADCLPVLFAARDASAVGAAHAGWRGLVGGVLEATVRKLNVEPSQLVAWLGPAIGPADFEVGEEVRTAFLAADAGCAAAFTANARGRWLCDLYALARRRLTALGLREVYGIAQSTFADPERYFSYRRAARCGRMAALVWLEPGAPRP